jgi:phosphatidylserine/phosphatidylglycerophosphate/cardiolipin synthase-like enzyme
MLTRPSLAVVLNLPLLVALVVAGPPGPPGAADADLAIAVRFAPDDKPVDELIERVGAATKSINIVTYSLHDSALAKLLAQKVYDGVTVQIVVDREPLSWRDVKSSVPVLHDAGAIVRVYGLDQGAGAAGKLRGCNFVVIDAGTDHAVAIVSGAPLTRRDLDDAPGTLITLTRPDLGRVFSRRFDDLMRRSAMWMLARERIGPDGKPKPTPRPGF